MGFSGSTCTLLTPEFLAFLYLSDLLTIECLSVKPNLTSSFQDTSQPVEKETIGVIVKNVMCYAVGYIIGLLFFIILIIIMGVATSVFIVRSCSADRYAAKLDSIPAYSGEIKLVCLSQDEFNQLNKDSMSYIPLEEYRKSIYRLNSQILKVQSELLERQQDLVLDIRQETNNNIEKESAWLAFWITVLTIVGVICPLGYQILNFKNEKENLEALKKKTDELEKEYKIKNEAFQMKFNTLSFTTLSEIKLEENEEGKMRELLINSIKKHYKQFLDGLKDISHDQSEIQEHISSVLINIYGFLTKINCRSNFEQSRKIRDLKDLILNTLKYLPDLTDFNTIKSELNKIRNKLDRL